MEAFSSILGRQLQFTIRMLGQVFWTPSGILGITFYSNIGLGQNRRRWKANKKLCKLMVRTAIRIVWKVPIRMETLSVRTAPAKILNFFQKLLSEH
jgi:hypothetical protein